MMSGYRNSAIGLTLGATSLVVLAGSFSLIACSSGSDISRDPSADGGKATDGTSGDPTSSAGGDTTVSGSRLKRRVLKGTDGSQQFVGWFDSERGENCSFMTAADGKQRCLPAISIGTGNYYEDSACTKPVLLVTDGCAPAKYAYQFESQSKCAVGGSPGTRVFEVGAKFVSGGSSKWYTGGGGSCLAGGGPFTPYSLQEIAPSAFVEATEEQL